MQTRHDRMVCWLGCLLLVLAYVQSTAQQPAPSRTPAADLAPFAVVELFTSEG